MPAPLGTFLIHCGLSERPIVHIRPIPHDAIFMVPDKPNPAITLLETSCRIIEYKLNFAERLVSSGRRRGGTLLRPSPLPRDCVPPGSKLLP